jgi:AhpD family alkylhydroperoxidase
MSAGTFGTVVGIAVAATIDDGAARRRHTGVPTSRRSNMSYHDTLRDLRMPTSSLRAATPDVWSGFTALHDATMADGVVPKRLKEVVALAMSVVKRCDGCIAYHARAAARAGASREEVAEMLAVALLMDGGTASVYAPRAWEAFNEFAAAQAAATSS